MVLPSLFLILVSFIGAQINAAATSKVKVISGIRGTRQNYEHDDKANERISHNHEQRSSFKKSTPSDATINDTGQPTHHYINDEKYNELNAFININVSMNIGGRSWSFHDTRSSVAPDEALKAMISLLSKEDREDLERDFSRGIFEIRRAMRDVTENTGKKKTIHATEMSDPSDILEDSEIEIDPVRKEENTIILSDELENERHLLQCNETEKSVQIRILVGSNTDELSWTLSAASNNTEYVIEQGGEYYTYDGDHTWYVTNTRIDESSCYTFSIIGESQNDTYYQNYDIIVDGKVHDSNVGYPGTQVDIGCNNDGDVAMNDDNVDEIAHRKNRCALNPILSPLNEINPDTFNTRTDKILSIITGVSDKHALTNPNSPEYKAACWIIYDDPLKLSATDISIFQRYILAVLYYYTDGESWSSDYNFLTGEDECDWNSDNTNEWGELGVNCMNGQVSVINLASNNLKGYIPSEVSKLESLDSLVFANNVLESTIPNQLGEISSLTSLVLSNNMMEGEMSDKLLDALNLEVLNVANNSLTGSLSSNLGNLTALKSLILSDNFFSGTVPEEIYKLSMLDTLKVDKNSFTGTISTTIGELFDLKSLDMSQNYFRGSIPTNMGNISLRSLNLEGNMLTGDIPNEIANLLNLYKMILSNNNLVGTIPSTIYMMTNLATIDMSNNFISGSLPSFPKKLQTVQLNKNLLESTIPAAIGNLSNLFKLRLEENELTGNVPQSVCRHFKNDPGSRYGYETIFTTDCAHEFLPPKVNCTCCTWCTGRFSSYDRVGSCPGGEISVDVNYKHSDWYKMSWYIRDRSGETIFQEGPLLSIPKESSYKACIPLTGCFLFKNYNPTGYTYMDRKIFVDDRLLDESDNTEIAFGYDSTIDSLSIDKCDEVMIYGKNLSKDSREIFNELAKSSGLSTLRDPKTPQYNAGQWILNDAESKQQDRSYLQRYILSLLYYSTLGDSWINSDGYLTEEHECKWYGITCDTKYMNVVRAINLSNNNLGGTLLSEIGELSALEYLDLSHNKNLTGEIPIEFANLWSLYGLNLANNFLNGTFPGTLGMMKNIKSIEMNNNDLNGNLPALVNMVSLETLNLANNYLDGVITAHRLPTQSLAFLNLASNLFSDQFPMSIVSALNLRELDLSHNYFTSSIPSSIGNLQHLVKLHLDQNKLRGTIPTSVSNMSKLIELTLHSNALTGTIPSQIGSLTQLMQLTVSYNSLKGGIPREIANLANLSLLHLQGNLLTGHTKWMNNCDTWSKSRSFIADCGEPSAVLSQLSCPCCTECCNAYKLCQTNDLRKFSPLEVALVSMGALCGLIILICTILIKIVSKKKLRMKFVNLDVVKASGDDSVYSLVFTKSATCWIITILTVLLQVFLFFLFLVAASFEFGDSDWVYTKRCPANSLECQDERRINGYAWVVFGIFLLICLLPDLANGCKLIFKATSSGCYRCLVSGIILIFVTSLAALTSFFYNYAIAMSNTEMIINAAVLLFVNDMDERVFVVLNTLRPDWMERKISDANRRAVALQQKSRGQLQLDCSPSSLRFRQTLKDNEDTVKQLMDRIETLEILYRRESKRDKILSHSSSDESRYCLGNECNEEFFSSAHPY